MGELGGQDRGRGCGIGILDPSAWVWILLLALKQVTTLPTSHGSLRRISGLETHMLLCGQYSASRVFTVAGDPQPSLPMAGDNATYLAMISGEGSQGEALAPAYS